MKKRRGRRGHNEEPRDGKKILTLIKAVSDHKGFKQMASYNMSCLHKLICPPLPSWKENLTFSLKNGGLEACTAAIRANSGDEGLLLSAASIIDQAGTTTEGASYVMETGSLDACLESIEKNKSMTVGVTRTTRALANVANTAPETIINNGTIDKIYKVMQDHKNRRNIIANCLLTLDKVSKNAHGMHEIVQGGGIATVIQALDFDALSLTEEEEDDEEGGGADGSSFLKPAFAMIRRFAGNNEENIEYLRQCGAVNAVIGAMDKVDERQHENIVQSGGALLSCIVTAEDLTNALVTINDESTSLQKVEQMTALVSNLALDSKNAVSIVESGGVESILRGLGNVGTAKTSSVALARLADTPLNAQRIVEANGVERLTEIVGLSGESAESFVAGESALGALAQLATSEGVASRLVQTGGLQMACSLATAAPQRATKMFSTLAIIECVAKTEDASAGAALIETGAPVAVIAAIQHNSGSPDLQARSIQVCQTMCHGDDAVISSIVQAGCVPVLLDTMRNSASKKTIQHSLGLLRTFTKNAGALKAMEQQSEMVKVVVKAMNQNFGDKSSREAASDTLACLVRPTHVSSAVAEIKQLVPLYNDNCDASIGERLVTALNVLSALADNAELRKTYENNDVGTVLKSVYKSTLVLDEAPELEGIITACSRVLHATIAAGNDREATLSGGVVKALVQNMKCHPTFESSIAAGLTFISMISEDSDSLDVCVREGGVEACVSALRAHSDNASIVSQATKSILAISSSENGVNAAVQKGAGRHLLNVVNNHGDDKTFSGAVLSSIKGLNKIAENKEGCSLLKKQDCKAIICQSSKSAAAGSSVAAQYSKFLGQVMSESEMESAVGECIAECEHIDAEKAYALSAKMETLSAALGNEENSQIASKTHLAYSLVSAISVASTMEDESSKHVLLGSSLKSLGKYSRHQTVDLSLGAAAWVCSVLRSEPSAAVSTLQCISELAGDVDQGHDLVENTAVELIAWKMAENPDNEEIQEAGLAALGNVMKTVGYASIKERCEAAGVESVAQNVLRQQMISPDESNIGTCLSGLKMLESMDSKSLASTEAVDVVADVLSAHAFSNGTPGDDDDVEDAEDAARKLEAVKVGVNVMYIASCGEASVAQELIAKGTLNKVLTYSLNNEAVLSDAASAYNTLNLLANVSGAEGLDKQKASACIVEAMMLNPTDVEIMEKGGNILSAYITKSDLSAKLQESSNLVLQINSGEMTKKTIAQTARAMAAVATMSSATGIMDENNTASASVLLESTSKVLASSTIRGAEYTEALTSSVQLMNRLARANVDLSQSECQKALLVEALNDTSTNESLKSSAIGCIGTMSTMGGAQGVATVAAMGGLEVITIAVLSKGNSGTTSKVAKESLQQITESATANVESVAQSSLLKIVEANAIVHDNDVDMQKSGTKQRRTTQTTPGSPSQATVKSSKMIECIDKLSATTHGQTALIGVLHESKSESAKVAVIQSIGSRVGEGQMVKLDMQNRIQVQNILSSVRAHMETSPQNNESNVNKSAAADVLGCLDLGDEGSGIFAEEGGLDILSNMIAADDGESTGGAQKAVRAMMNIMAADKQAAHARGKKDGRVVNRLKDLKIASVIASALATSKEEDDGFADDCIMLLQELTSEVEPEEVGLDDEAIRNIKNATKNRKSSINMGSSFIKSLAHMSQVAAALAAEGFVNEEILLAHWEVVTEELRAQDVVIDEFKTEDGKTYFLNRHTGATSWTKPVQKLNRASFERLANLLHGIGNNNIPMVHNLAYLLKAIETQSDDIGMLTVIFGCVEKWAVNNSNMLKMAENNAVVIVARAIHKAVSSHDPAKIQRVLVSCALIIGRLSSVSELKDGIMESNAIQLLMHATWTQIAHKQLVKECIIAFGNFAFDNDAGVKAMVQQGVIKLVEKVLQTYPDQNRLMELTLVTLSNLMYGNDVVKKDLGLTCGDEIVDVVKRIDGSKVQKAAMRALGNLASIDENIQWILKNKGAEVIVSTIKKLEKDKEVVQTAIEVLGNLASIEDPEHEMSCHRMMLEQGCSKCLLGILRNCTDLKLIVTIWEVLSAITVDEELCDEFLVPDGIVSAMATSIKKYDWNEDVVSCIAHLIHSMCYFNHILIEIAEEQIVPNLLSAMEQHADNEDLLINAQSSITILATHEEEQEIIVEEGGLEILYRLMSTHGSNKTFLLELLNTMIQISCNEKYVETVALTGMNDIVSAVSSQGNDPEALSQVLILLGQFALHDKTLNDIIQFGGVKLVIDAASEYPDDVKLVMSAIHTLDNIGTASTEHSHIVNDQGGLELLKYLEEAYDGSDGNQEIAFAAKSAVMTIEAQIKLGVTSQMGVGFNKNMIRHLEKHTVTDKLAESRKALSKGLSVVDWSMSKKKMEMKVSEAWNTIDFTLAKKGTVKRILHLDSIVSITIGRRYGGHSSLTGKANKDLAFYFTTKAMKDTGEEKESFIDLAGESESEMNNMVRAVRALLRVWREDPANVLPKKKN
jgi:hypothetical protein